MQRAVAEMNHVTDAAAAAASPHPHPRVEVNKNKQLLQWTVGALEIISITANDGKAFKPFPTGCIELHSPLYGVVFFCCCCAPPPHFDSLASRVVMSRHLRFAAQTTGWQWMADESGKKSKKKNGAHFAPTQLPIRSVRLAGSRPNRQRHRKEVAKWYVGHASCVLAVHPLTQNPQPWWMNRQFFSLFEEWQDGIMWTKMQHK